MHYHAVLHRCCRDKALLFLWDEQEQALHGVTHVLACC
jgi:hypothetical protein